MIIYLFLVNCFVKEKKVSSEDLCEDLINEEALACFVVDRKNNLSVVVTPTEVVVGTPGLVFRTSVANVEKIERDVRGKRIVIYTKSGKLKFNFEAPEREVLGGGSKL